MSHDREPYERRFRQLVEDYLRAIEDANDRERLLPAREVIDHLGRCRRHNFSRRDAALLGQARLARRQRDNRWLDIAAREARAIGMWDREWIRSHLEHRPDRRDSTPRRPARQLSPEITKEEEEALLQEDPQDAIRLEEPPRDVAPLDVLPPAPVTASSEPAARPKEGPRPSRASAKTSQSSSGASRGDRAPSTEERRLGKDVRRRGHRDSGDRSGHSGPLKKPRVESRFETVSVPRTRGLTVEVPLLESSAPTPVFRGAQCPITDCSGDGSRKHAFECHLPPIFREEITGNDVTIRRLGALSLIAQWLLGSRSTLRTLANYFHLMDVTSQIDGRLSPLQQQGMTGVCLQLGSDSPSHFDLSQSGNQEWILVHWAVLLHLLSRIQPVSRLQSLREIYPLTQEDEAMLPKPPLAFDSHCHLDRCRKDFRLRPDASLQEICAKAQPDDKHVVALEGVVANFCDPETYPSPEEIRTLTNQGCFVTVGIHPKKVISDEDLERLQTLLGLPEVSGLGEVGVDHTEPVETWPDQTDKLVKAIRAAKSTPKLIVLHCRGMENQDSGEAYNLLRMTLRCYVGAQTLMHLHCFSGGPSVVDRWLDAFPNTYFGFTKMVGGFTGELAQAVRDLHESRLLIETDAPYFHYLRNRHSTPAVIGMTAADLGKIRGSDWRAILTTTRENAKRLYGQHRPPALD